MLTISSPINAERLLLRPFTADGLALAFRDLKLHRVYGRAGARDSASANLMRRLGMRQEAHFMQNELFKGEWGDEVVFALLEDEWKQ